MPWVGFWSTIVAFPGNTHLLIHLGQLARDCVVLIFVCFSVLYLGDDAWISSVSFMQTKHLCGLIHIWTKGDVDAVKPV